MQVTAVTPKELLEKFGKEILYNGEGEGDKKEKAKVIDFLSLDVEGTELDVVEAWPFQEWSVLDL